MQIEAGAMLALYRRWLMEGVENPERREEEIRNFEEVVASCAARLAVGALLDELDVATDDGYTERAKLFVLDCFRDSREGRGPLA